MADQNGANRGDVSGKQRRRVGPLKRACLAVPGWAFLPLTVVLTVSVLLTIMLPVYFATRDADEQQTEAKFYPADMTMDELETLVKDQINLEIEVLDVKPEEHEAAVVFAVHPGGNFSAWDDIGLMMLPDGAGSVLVITVGEQMAVKINHGDVSDDISLTYIMAPVTRLFYYPFDEYEIVLELEATYLDPNEVANPLPVGVVYAGGRQGWSLTERFIPVEGMPANMGVKIVVNMERSMAVKLCAILIMIFMWSISLAMFALSINFLISDEDPSYDVPAISVGLLFALPFVRSVMPDVPDVGLACDVLGFFWNLILVALSTILTMASITRKYRRQAGGGGAADTEAAPPRDAHAGMWRPASADDSGKGCLAPVNKARHHLQVHPGGAGES